MRLHGVLCANLRSLTRKAEVGKFYNPPPFCNTGGPEHFRKEWNKMDHSNIPDMETFLHKHGYEISRNTRCSLAYKAVTNVGCLHIDDNILKIMGAEIAVLIALFIETKEIASMHDDPHYAAYYENETERKLSQMDKYHKDDEGNVWFTLPLKKIREKTFFSIETIKEHIQLLKSINLLKVEKEKRFKKYLTWYYISDSAYAGMMYYCAWKAGDTMPWEK